MARTAVIAVNAHPFIHTKDSPEAHAAKLNYTSNPGADELMSTTNMRWLS